MLTWTFNDECEFRAVFFQLAEANGERKRRPGGTIKVCWRADKWRRTMKYRLIIGSEQLLQ